MGELKNIEIEGSNVLTGTLQPPIEISDLTKFVKAGLLRPLALDDRLFVSQKYPGVHPHRSALPYVC